MKNPFRYRGYVWDAETELYYLGSRYYDAKVGRFLNADDIDIIDVQDDLYDKNLYLYCDNNPINRIDETGNIWELAFAGIGAMSVGSGLSVSSLGASIFTVLGIVTPVALSIIGTVAIIGDVSLGIKYAKEKAKGQDKAKSKEKAKGEEKERVTSPIGRRLTYNSRKAAKEAAQRAGKGKIPNKHPKYSHGNKKAHYHPNVKNNYRVIPHGVSSHDDYYYPR